MRDFLIKYAYNKETSDLYDSEELFPTAKEGAIIRERYSRGEFHAYCCECDQQLEVAINNVYGHCFFKHLPNHSYCILSEENLTENKAKRYNQSAKESYRHKYLKTRIGELLKCTAGVDASTVSVDNLFINDGEEKRKPDVFCVYNGIRLAFEVQLSTLSIGEIRNRSEFYKRNKIYLIWIRDEFDTQSQSMTDKDIKYNDEYQNIFQLNEKADNLELICHYKKPFLYYDDVVRRRWEKQSVTLDRLQYDDDYNIYYYDFPSEELRFNEIAEERKQKQLEEDERIRAMAIIGPILNKIRSNFNNNVQSYISIENDLKSLDYDNLEAFRKEFRKENNNFEDLIESLDKAHQENSYYYSFLFSSPEVGLNFTQFKEKTLLMSILENKNLWMDLIICLFENGYQLTGQDMVFVKETKPTKGFDNSDILIWVLYWLNTLKDRKLSRQVYKYYKSLFSILSAIKGKVKGFGWKDHELIQVANNAIDNYKNCWPIIEKAFRKNPKVWADVNSRPSFKKKQSMFPYDQIVVDDCFVALCRELFPEIMD